MYDLNRARYEQSLAVAHKALFKAKLECDRMQDDNAYEQLAMCLTLVTGLNEASLSRRKAKRIKGQLSWDDLDHVRSA